MKIVKKRIRSIGNYLIGIADGDEFYISYTNFEELERVISAGFTEDLNIGELVLPSIIGPRTRFNADGGFIKHKDQPKERRTRQATVKDWHGNNHTIGISYLRYPRTPIPAPEVELLIVEDPEGNKIIRSISLVKGVTDENEIVQIINLFLELFGECDTLQSNLIPVFNVPVIRLNWTFLPPGEYPWERLRTDLPNITRGMGVNRTQLIESRLETITNHNPSFVAVGSSGFRGYIVFGFDDYDFFILESIYLGNATYVFGQNWEEISILTKNEILNDDLQNNRIIHQADWVDEINNLFI